MPKKSKKKTRKLRKLSPDAGQATLALTERRLHEQSSRLDRLHRRRILLLGVITGALATYAIVAALAVGADHLPTAILAVGAAIPLLALSLRSATLAWPPRETVPLGPAIDQTIARTPGTRGARNSEATPRPRRRDQFSEPDLRRSLAQWNALTIDTNEAALEHDTIETERAARWTLGTALAVAAALLALGIVRTVARALEDDTVRATFVG